MTATMQLIDAAIAVGGALGGAVLTTIEGHAETPAVAAQRATEEKERLAQSSASIDKLYDAARERRSNRGP